LKSKITIIAKRYTGSSNLSECLDARTRNPTQLRATPRQNTLWKIDSIWRLVAAISCERKRKNSGTCVHRICTRPPPNYLISKNTLLHPSSEQSRIDFYYQSHGYQLFGRIGVSCRPGSLSYWHRQGCREMLLGRRPSRQGISGHHRHDAASERRTAEIAAVQSGCANIGEEAIDVGA
jgi:hypothetical protein